MRRLARKSGGGGLLAKRGGAEAAFDAALALLDEARRLRRELEAPELPPDEALVALALEVRGLLARTSALLLRVERVCGRKAGGGDERLAALAEAARAARRDVEQGTEGLAGCAAGEPLAIECDHALQHVRRALRAFVQELSAAVLQQVPSGGMLEELAAARAVRAAYGSLRAKLRRAVPPGAAPEQVLAAAEEALDALLGSEAASGLRLQDRLVLEALRARIAERGGDAAAAGRLVAEVTGTVDRLRAINAREILVRADREVAGRIDRLFAAGRGGAALDEVHGALAGRDDRLDEAVAAALEALERIRVLTRTILVESGET